MELLLPHRYSDLKEYDNCMSFKWCIPIGWTLTSDEAQEEYEVQGDGLAKASFITHALVQQEENINQSQNPWK